MLQQVREFFERHGESRFSDWDRAADQAAAPVRDRAGFKRRVKEKSGEVVGTVFYVFPNVFRGEVAEGYEPLAVLKLLKAKGLLRPDQGRPYDCSVRLPGMGKSNCYRIDDTILSAGDEG